MKEQIKGKKLLVLGGTVDEINLVKRAQKLGAYVIVTDYYENRDISVAKTIADEAWDVSWSDVPQIVQKCKDNKIDGITAGYSEIKIDYLIKICKCLDKPCYINEKQLEITRNKKLFKEYCRSCNVPTVKEYVDVDSVDEYPVIVKPVDRSAAIGIHICHNHSKKGNEKQNPIAFQQFMKVEV